MSFGLSVSNEPLGHSDVITNIDGARGLQLLVVVGAASDDDNMIEISLTAIASDPEVAGEILRFTEIPVEQTVALLLYPGIGESGTRVSAVLPATFQLTASNVMGLDMTVQVYGELLP